MTLSAIVGGSVPIDTLVVKSQNDTLVVIRGGGMGAGEQESGKGTAGAIVRPPLLFAGAAALGLLLDRLPPWPTLPAVGPVHWVTAAVLILVGLAVFVAGVQNFSSAKTPVQGGKPTRALVTSGIHGRSRNPIYVGMFAIYGGIAVATLSPSMAVLALPLAITMRYGVVAREETYLEKLFGDSYRDYKSRVRRWL
jgi:protein-S-isoprenylcysteine O-methyltransferase Ste14